MSYAIELRILECKGTQYDKFGFWKLEFLKISSSFFSFFLSAYYVYCSIFGWFWMQMKHKSENQCVPTPIQYIEFQVLMHLQFCVSDIMWKNYIVLFLYHRDKLLQGLIWTMWRALTSIFNLGSYIYTTFVCNLECFKLLKHQILGCAFIRVMEEFDFILRASLLVVGGYGTTLTASKLYVSTFFLKPTFCRGWCTWSWQFFFWHYFWKCCTTFATYFMICQPWFVYGPSSFNRWNNIPS